MTKLRLTARSLTARSLTAITLACLASLHTGCGGSQDEEVIVDPLHLIENFDPNPVRHHPRKLVEISLGQFAVSMPAADKIDVISIEFEAFAVVARDEQEELIEKAESRSSRLHDHVLNLLQKIDPKELSDPNLTWLKSEMIPLVNRVLQTDQVRDIVFGNFSVHVG